MEYGYIGLAIILCTLIGAWFLGLVRNGHKHDIAISNTHDNRLRLQQLINISGGGSLAQIIRLYNIRGKQLSTERLRLSNSQKIKSLTRDRILLQSEINRIISIEVERESNYCQLT